MKAFLKAFIILLLLTCIVNVNPVLSSDSPNIVINEIMFNPDKVPDSRGEWFELYNPNDFEIDLSGWKIEDGANDSFLIDTTLVIGPSCYLVFGREGDIDRNGGVSIDYEYSGMNLSNARDEIRIVSDDGVVIDSVAYDPKNGFSFPCGASIELRNPSLPNDQGINWAFSTYPYGLGDMGTPGERNSCHKDIRIANPSLPIMLFNLVLRGGMQASSEWVTELDEAQGHAHPPEELEGAEDDMGSLELKEKGNVALFCDNKSQYYDHLKASLLFALLEEMSFAVNIYSDGLLSSDALYGVDLLIITNPQEAFLPSELDA
ncbi:MAG: lamin tail domain-containing protein, partial [Candidatus Methanofastidiosa archaeon]|nr:lamin tail domain-containing protein [Candidatus Methanofastidiosa archaeon]